jgi:Flp pilus assembly pilin Flp
MVMKHMLKRLIRQTSGVAYIEFALIIPILLLMFAGGVELTRYIQANQKVDTAAVQLANFISQQEEPENIDYQRVSDNVFRDLMSPFTIGDSQFVVSEIIPIVNQDTGDVDSLEISWQESKGGLGASGASRIGSVGDAPNFGPTGVDEANVGPNEKLIAVEVFYQYTNIIPAIDAFTDGGVLNFSGDAPLYKRSVMRYRLGAVRSRQEGEEQTPPDYIECCGDYCDDTVIDENGNEVDGEDAPGCLCLPGWCTNNVYYQENFPDRCPPCPPPSGGSGSGSGNSGPPPPPPDLNGA